jgi:hypothetical protein
LAFQNISELLSIECNAIKLLRNLKPRIDTLKKADFKKVGINADSRLIINLLKPFTY